MDVWMYGHVCGSIVSICSGAPLRADDGYKRLGAAAGCSCEFTSEYAAWCEGRQQFAKSLWGVRPFLVSTDVGSVEFTGRQAYMRLWFSLQSRVDGWRFYSPSGTAVPMSAWWLVEWKDLAWVQDCGGSAFFV
jgi:hypothetical protein